MKAIRFDYSLPRLAAAKICGTISPKGFTGPWGPLRLADIESAPPAEGWVRVKTKLAGICGSDLTQVALAGACDNPLTAQISFPHVMGHEGTGETEAGGSIAGGTRVVLNPWLACKARGITPPCRRCAAGQQALCLSLAKGPLAAGMHHGTNARVPGVFAETFTAHESQLHVVPDGVSDRQAVLADPFAVSLHAVLRRPPAPGAAALVYGCGTLGLCAIAVLRRLFPESPVYAVGRHEHQVEAARKLGAEHVLSGSGADIVARVAELEGVEIRRPWFGSPWLHEGVGVVYDTVGTARSLETAIRCVDSRGAVVITGVATPARFEWTPVFMKEVEVVGSNAFGCEEIGGERRHAFDWYLDFCRDGLDLSELVTHAYPLEAWREAFAAAGAKSRSRAIKVCLQPGA